MKWQKGERLGASLPHPPKSNRERVKEIEEENVRSRGSTKVIHVSVYAVYLNSCVRGE